MYLKNIFNQFIKLVLIKPPTPAIFSHSITLSMETNQEIVGKQNEALVLSGKHCAWGHLIEEMSPYVGEALSKAFPDVQLKSPNKGVQQPFSGRNMPPSMLISMHTLP